MSTNILKAIYNIVKNPITDLVSHYQSPNRINSVGEALEFYIKDIFCNSLEIEDLNEKNKIYSKNFSYIGNQANPPDLIIKKGDVVEVKKIEGPRAGIALNSSYPKDKLYSDSPMITQSCRGCEDWTEKEVVYVVGVAKKNKLKSLWFAYGNCYAASRETYERIKDRISLGIIDLENIEFSETRELGRVNKVDPLGITYLRIRGMWHIENPSKVFEYLPVAKSNSGFAMNAIILKENYSSFSKEDRERIEKLKVKNFSIKDVGVKSPNNPAKLLEAKLLTFTEE
ncbi:hypothetical protein ES702_07537 [subsurface metagenome]